METVKLETVPTGENCPRAARDFTGFTCANQRNHERDYRYDKKEEG